MPFTCYKSQSIAGVSVYRGSIWRQALIKSSHHISATYRACITYVCSWFRLAPTKLSHFSTIEAIEHVFGIYPSILSNLSVSNSQLVPTVLRLSHPALSVQPVHSQVYHTSRHAVRGPPAHFTSSHWWSVISMHHNTVCHRSSMHLTDTVYHCTYLPTICSIEPVTHVWRMVITCTCAGYSQRYSQRFVSCWNV